MGAAEPPRARANSVATAPPTPNADADADDPANAALAAEAEPAADPLLDAADRHWMGVALEQARLAGERGEVPVGAVVVVSQQAEDEQQDGRGGRAQPSPSSPPLSSSPPAPPSLVLGAPQGNRAEAQLDPTAHAESLALRSALAALSAQGRSWRASLPRATLYATCEPCPMCAGASLACRVGRVVYGCRQPRVGADGSWVPLLRAVPPPSPPLPAPATPPASGVFNAGAEEGEEGSKDEETAQERGASPPFPPPAPPLSRLPPHRPPHPYNPGLEVRSGVRGHEAAELLQAFFRRRRMEGIDSKLQE